MHSSVGSALAVMHPTMGVRYTPRMRVLPTCCGSATVQAREAEGNWGMSRRSVAGSTETPSA